MDSHQDTSVVAELANRLRRDISLGIILPGERLNIEAIKREQKVSHPSIREALSLLTGEGYLSSEGQRGYRVLDSSTEELRDMTRLRAELESTGLAWSLDRANTDWRASVVAAHHALTEVEAEMRDDPVSFAIEWDERNRKFHAALLSNCGSPKLIETVNSLYNLTRRYRLMAYSQSKGKTKTEARLRQSSEEHSMLKDMALAGHRVEAVELLRKHVSKNAETGDADIILLKEARR